MNTPTIILPGQQLSADRQRKGLNGGIYILDGQGRPVPEVYAILEVVNYSGRK